MNRPQKFIRKILLILASIWAMFITIVLVINYFYSSLAWDMFFISLGIITIPFLLARITHKLSIVSFMIEIHENNLLEAEKQENFEMEQLLIKQ
jgi:hypothetical protein